MTLLSLNYIRWSWIDDGDPRQAWYDDNKYEEWGSPKRADDLPGWEQRVWRRSKYHLVVFERRWINPRGYVAAQLDSKYGVEWSDSGSLRDKKRQEKGKREEVREGDGEGEEMGAWQQLGGRGRKKERMRGRERNRERDRKRVDWEGSGLCDD